MHQGWPRTGRFVPRTGYARSVAHARSRSLGYAPRREDQRKLRRAGQHLLISKMEDVASKRMVTRVQPLSAQSRREELARMLSGATVTEAARAQADQLLAGKG